VSVLLLVIVLALFFASAGLSKVMNPERHVDTFAQWGYPSWFVYFTGVVEVGGAVLLLVRSLRLYGVAILGVTMMVATLTHFQAGEMAAVPVPLVLFVLTVGLGVLERKRSG
jgi:putative oxidoreductase